MRITVDGLPVDYNQIMFPDGQVHFTISPTKYLVDSDDVRITTRLVHALDFIELLLVKEVLDHQGVKAVDLFITYMSGARMDRRIDCDQPFTLKVFAKLVSDAGFNKVVVLDPHSDVTTALLDAHAVYPIGVLKHLLSLPEYQHDTVIVAPDAGAIKRVDTMLAAVGSSLPIVQGLKHRDTRTGELTGFSMMGDVANKRCLIIDDICDGGGTFVGLAEVLTQHEASTVDLFVTHGIFSKGKRLTGIANIYTTDSYFTHRAVKGFSVVPLSDYGDAPPT